ncbi:MAG TPA: hypothetical protein VKC56_13645 [Gallionellaceae bacterium]|nr:hypothetical protein [Gallionellaceae bacterium]
MEISKEQLLLEIEDIIRTMPPRETLSHESDENLSWLGRAAAGIAAWDSTQGALFKGYLATFHGINAVGRTQAFRNMITTLHQARSDLRMNTIGPMSAAIPTGAVFDYFDEVRKVIEAAKTELFFVDPYLDAEFVSRYLPHVTQGVQVRLLSRERIASLLPAVQAFRQQTGLQIEIRSAQGFHDRFVFVDGSECYQSGASFKDGAKKAPTTLTQIGDAFQAMKTTYEALWGGGTIQ